MTSLSHTASKAIEPRRGRSWRTVRLELTAVVNASGSSQSEDLWTSESNNDRGIRHAYIKPATPRLNGKVERSQRIDQKEFYRMLDGVVIDETELFNDKLQEWEDSRNFNRPLRGSRWTDPVRAAKTRDNPTNPTPGVSRLRPLHSPA